MQPNGQIPPATQAKLAGSFPKGTRHQAKIDIAVPLIGNGMAPQAVYQQLKAQFPEASENEIEGVIDWVVKANPKPTEYGRTGPPTGSGATGFSRSNFGFRAERREPEKPKRTPTEQTNWWTNGSRYEPDAMERSSPTPIPQTPEESCILAIGSLYSDTDLLNVVLQFFVDPKHPEKAKPHGGGKILKRDDWVEWVQSKGVPHSDAGAWIRINPCAGMGSGKDFAVVDDDITNFRYLLVESDKLPIAMQLALYQRLKLPIAAIILSGGGSAHAWVRIEAPDEENYKKTVELIFDKLEPFGIDRANKNPSRLCRMPGAMRVVGATEGGLQRLLFLNPTVPALTEDGLKLFEESLEFPAIEERPLRVLALSAIDRYEEMRRNVGRLGVPYGIPALDQISGGMKPGQTVVVAGVTGGGKSTMGLHIIGAALNAGHGVALFSLEMDREEVFDLIMSNRCEINRNKFNNGTFVDYDLEIMAAQLPAISRLPLYIEDSALTSADQIRLRVLQLKAAGKIGVVIVDYIQFVNPGLTRENREQQIASISHTLRALARETKIPFVILSQLNDEGKLRESRVIAHNANVVILVEVEAFEEGQARTTAEVKAKIIKGRGIPKAEFIMTYDLMFARLVPESIVGDSPSVTQPEFNTQPDP